MHIAVPVSLTWVELDRIRYEARKQDTERIRVNLIHSNQSKRCVYRRLEVKQNAVLQLDTLCQFYSTTNFDTRLTTEGRRWGWFVVEDLLDFFVQLWSNLLDVLKRSQIVLQLLDLGSTCKNMSVCIEIQDDKGSPKMVVDTRGLHVAQAKAS